MSFSSFGMWWIRCTRRRRSTSSWVRPSPRCRCRRPVGKADHWRAQTRQPVLQQREFDLGLAPQEYARSERDVQDHRGGGRSGTSENLLQVALLGRERIVLRRPPCPSRARDNLAQFVHLARPRMCGVGGVSTFARPEQRRRPSGISEQRQFVELAFEFLSGAPVNCTPTSTIFIAERAFMRVVE